jgi:hypothetical protein
MVVVLPVRVKNRCKLTLATKGVGLRDAVSGNAPKDVRQSKSLALSPLHRLCGGEG